MLRLAAARSSKLLPCALGAIATSRVVAAGSIANAEHRHQLVRSNTAISCSFSTVSPDAMKKIDRKLSRALKSEIKDFDPSLIQATEAPAGFPFEIEDDPWREVCIELKREFEGEKIVAEVFNTIYPEDYTSDEDDDGGYLHSEEEILENPCCFPQKRPRIQLTVRISKENVETMRIMLWGTAGNVGYPKVYVANKFVPFNELDFDWKEFLRVRGIDDSLPKYLMDYMEKRRDRIYLLHLKKFRQFIKE